MPNTRELKKRILSVYKTRKMTQAMKMVSAAKFRRATEALFQARPYNQTISNTLQDLMARLEPDFIPRYFQENKSAKEAIIVITGDRGLCGGFNANVIKAVEANLRSGDTQNKTVYVFGNKGHVFFKRRDYNVAESHVHFIADISLAKVQATFDSLIDQYVSGDIGKVWVFYNQYVTALTSNLTQKQLLPIIKDELEPKKIESVAEDSSDNKILTDYIYDSGKESTIDKFLDQYLNFKIYESFLESNAAEQGARMTAMDAATDNAGDMIKRLTLLYNRIRQANITREIAEIVGGAEALSG